MMIDHNIILNKTSKVHHHLNRIRGKREISLEDFLMDLDRQEIILFNLQMAVQNCIDVAAHIISDDELEWQAARARCSISFRKMAT
jgi:uncharacterized protein YutE (UPF0331/DUF86 family)